MRVQRRITPWRQAVFLKVRSTGKLTFLSDVIVIFEAEVDMKGNFSEVIDFTFFSKETCLRLGLR
jgi:hypothetical protein